MNTVTRYSRGNSRRLKGREGKAKMPPCLTDSPCLLPTLIPTV